MMLAMTLPGMRSVKKTSMWIVAGLLVLLLMGCEDTTQVQDEQGQDAGGSKHAKISFKIHNVSFHKLEDSHKQKLSSGIQNIVVRLIGKVEKEQVKVSLTAGSVHTQIEHPVPEGHSDDSLTNAYKNSNMSDEVLQHSHSIPGVVNASSGRISVDAPSVSIHAGSPTPTPSPTPSPAPSPTPSPTPSSAPSPADGPSGPVKPAPSPVPPPVRSTGTSGDARGTGDLSMNSTTGGLKKTCSQIESGDIDLAQISGPNFEGVAQFPTTNSDAHKALSMCMTQIPACNPAELSGIADVRLTYSKASGSLLPAKYLSVLGNSNLMQQLQGGLSCTADEFKEAYNQLYEEVTFLQLMTAYYASYAEVITSLGAILEVSFEENFEALLEKAVEATTTTTTAKKRLMKKLFDITCGVLNVVGLCFGVPGLGSTVKMVGKSMVTVSKIASGQESVGSFMKNAVKKETGGLMEGLLAGYGGGGTSWGYGTGYGGGGDYGYGGGYGSSYGSGYGSGDSDGDGDGDGDGAGAQDDDKMDVMNLDALAFAQRITSHMQQIITLERMVISTNWGRMQAAMSIIQACPLTQTAIQKMLQAARPAADWLTMSVLVGAKYEVFYQRVYTIEDGPSPPGSPASQCQTECSLPGGCYTTGENYIDLSNGYPATRTYWLGEVGLPNYGPPASWWNYLLRKGGPAKAYIAKVYGVNVSTIQDLSNAMMSQCQYIPKLWVGSSVSTPSPSLFKVHCNIFGAPWPVVAMPDCPGWYPGSANVWNTYSCTSSDSCPQNVANFNSQFYIPPVTHEYSSMYTPGELLSGSDIIPAGSYTLENVNAPGQYANAAGNGQTAGTNVQMWDNPNAPSTQWKIQEVSNQSGIYTLENVNAPGLYLSCPGGTTTGTNVVLETTSNETSSQWSISANGSIYTMECVSAKGQYLNAANNGVTSGTNLQTSGNPGFPSTQWQLKGVGKIDGLIGCCYPWMDVADIPKECDVLVCDCATLASWKWVQLGVTADFEYWWGVCDVETFASATFEQNIGSSEDYIATSVGYTWNEVFSSFGKLHKALKKYDNLTSQQVAAIVNYTQEQEKKKVATVNAALASQPQPSPGGCTKHQDCQSGASNYDDLYCAPGGGSSSMELCSTCASDGHNVDCNALSSGRRRQPQYCQCTR
eukprot:TRINITY_DN35655_c0_g1_i1.p1 TRINITY_DN35655_c0_g1~~TRINITY_DN35655_c0_g1_i1.p1  ORF type:complete len:1153 (-),score=174.09 TRINITY_DN35655_c0_g1_i1:117-3575(-)